MIFDTGVDVIFDTGVDVILITCTRGASVASFGCLQGVDVILIQVLM